MNSDERREARLSRRRERKRAHHVLKKGRCDLQDKLGNSDKRREARLNYRRECERNHRTSESAAQIETHLAR